MKFASIVPLIGGETIAMEQALGRPPDYLLSYSPFRSNDSHLVEHYKRSGKDVPYLLIDEGGKHPHWVDVVNAVCPCAGLSSLSQSAGSDNHNNKWMMETAKYVLGEMKPTVFWGENAPALGADLGKPVLDALRKTAADNGYSTGIYMTSSHLHGIGQVRVRSFYFFWKGDKVPILPRVSKKQTDIDAFIGSMGDPDQADTMSVLANEAIPSRDPFYRFVLEEIEGGISHKQFQSKIQKTVCVLNYIEDSGANYRDVSKWMEERQMHKHAARCERMQNKLDFGGNIMRKHTEVPKGRINAFVGHMPYYLTHPHKDRYLTIRECLSIMGMPEDFVLQGGKKNINHICQNVPVKTARDMAESVILGLSGSLPYHHGSYLRQDNRKHEAAPQFEEAFG